MKENTNKKFWQNVAKLYTPSMRGNKKLYDEICTLIRPNLTPEIHMLELATGPGMFARELANTGAQILATDYAENMVLEAKRQGAPANVRFEVADATALPYENDRFDVVLIANALHIMPEPEKALVEIHRVLCSGGFLIAPTFVHGTSVKARLSIRLMEMIGFHVYHKWSNEQFTRLIETHGFEVTKRVPLNGMMPLLFVEAKKVMGL